MSDKFDKKLQIGVGVLIAVVLLVILAVSCGGDSGEQGTEPVQGTVAGSEQAGNQGDESVNGGAVTGESSVANGSESAAAGNEQAGTPGKVEATPAPGTPTATPAPGEGEDGSQTQMPGFDITRADAPYEKWLAAGMILAASMQYPDFQFEGVYITGEHELTDRMSSAGAYLKITTGGQTVVIESKPLSEERSADGTLDLYTGDLGFNTFDIVAGDSFDTYGLTEISVDDLSELINQSILVTIYEH